MTNSMTTRLRPSRATHRISERAPDLALPLTAIIIVGAVVRMWSIHVGPLSTDEGFALWVARQPWQEIPEIIADVDTHPPFHYAITRLVVTTLGSSLAALRLPAVMAGVATIPIVAMIGGIVAGRRAALIAATLLALSPFHVNASQHFRYYAWSSLAVALVLWATASLLYTGRPLRESPFVLRETIAWPVFASGAILALYTHNLAPLVLIPANASLLIARLSARRRRPNFSLVSWMVTLSVSMMVWLPWAPNFLRQASELEELDWLDLPTLRDVLATSRSTYAEFTRSGADLGWFVDGAWTFGWLDIVVLILLIAALKALGTSEAVLLLGALATLPVLELVYSWMVQPLFRNVTFIMVVPPMVVLIAVGADSLVRRGSRLQAYVAVLALVLVNAVALVLHVTIPDGARFQTVASILDRQVESEDVIVFSKISHRMVVDEERSGGQGVSMTVELGRSAYTDDARQLAEVADSAETIWLVIFNREAEVVDGEVPIEGVVNRTHVKTSCPVPELCYWQPREGG